MTANTKFGFVQIAATALVPPRPPPPPPDLVDTAPIRVPQPIDIDETIAVRGPRRSSIGVIVLVATCLAAAALVGTAILGYGPIGQTSKAPPK